VLVFGDKVAGYANYGRNRARACTSKARSGELYLRPNSRASASAAGCYRRAARPAESGLKSMVIWALSDNDPATEFYRALGGRMVARSSENSGPSRSTRSPSPGPTEFRLLLHPSFTGDPAIHRFPRRL
jgi:hypothetical protein